MSSAETFLYFDGKIYLHLAYDSPDMNALRSVKKYRFFLLKKKKRICWYFNSMSLLS